MSFKDFKVKRQGNNYDIVDFLQKHPGGINYIQPFKEKDVEEKMKATNHSSSAFYLLREYKEGGRDTKRINGDPDLEHLVDWNKPILWQLGELGDKYYEWVSSPVDRDIRLFESDILEKLTYTHWYSVLIMWIPLYMYFSYTGFNNLATYYEISYPIMIFLIHSVVGFIFWTLLEYCIHRWLFHMIPTGKSKFAIYFHFAVHGLHHKVPFDPGRLVMPPGPALFYGFLVHCIYSAFLPQILIPSFYSGSIIGYVTYDMTHYYLHHGLPSEKTYMYNLKRYHNYHHFGQQEVGFGVSSTMWDNVFGTLIHLKKLAMAIRWYSGK